jgi:hypothetical protein
VKDGVVVFDEKPGIADGTIVEVLPVGATLRRGSPEAIRALKGNRWIGPPGELDRLLAEVQEMRAQDVLYPNDDRSL